jgi:nucleoredoxin
MKLILSLLSLAIVSTSAFAGNISTSLRGDLVALKGKRVSRFDDATLANTKHFAIYFSASWCPPCRQFTPDLVTWYNNFKPKHPDFELIFISSDRDEKSMEDYMEQDKMPWPGIKFSKIRTNKSLMHLKGKGIPCLVLIDDQGTILSHSYEGLNYVGPRKVMKDIEQKLGGAATP